MTVSKKLNLAIIFFAIFLHSCGTIRESAGVNRKSIDEFQSVESAPLVIPPDFILIPPDQIQEKKIGNVEKELAQEILFGLDENNPKLEKEVSTMNQILSQTGAKDISDEIRNEIDENFAKEKKTRGIFQTTWKNEVDVLDAIKESERIRNKNFEGESIAEGEIITKKQTIKTKKRKRFFFF